MRRPTHAVAAVVLTLRVMPGAGQILVDEMLRDGWRGAGLDHAAHRDDRAFVGPAMSAWGAERGSHPERLQLPARSGHEAPSWAAMRRDVAWPGLAWPGLAWRMLADFQG
jgi:hypothetical protein